MVVVEVKEKWLIGVVVVFLAWSFGGGKLGGLGRMFTTSLLNGGLVKGICGGEVIYSKLLLEWHKT